MKTPYRLYRAISSTYRLLLFGAFLIALEVAVLGVGLYRIMTDHLGLVASEFLSGVGVLVILFTVFNLVFIVRIVQHQTQLELAKKVFVSLASHQLRTPATAVKNVLSILLEGYAGSLSQEQEKYVAVATESNERQLRIIEALLYAAQLENEQLKLRLEKLSLAALVATAVEPHQTAIDARQQKLNIDADDQLFVIGDEVCLVIALDNLVSNATKFTPEGGSIDISVRQRFNQAVITITDTGVGVKRRDFDQLFRKFSRIDNPLSTKVGGTGLGLYIAKRMFELHHGKITANSNTRIGAQFKVTIPIAPLAEETFDSGD